MARSAHRRISKRVTRRSIARHATVQRPLWMRASTTITLSVLSVMLMTAIIFSYLHVTTAATPNPGHAFSEVDIPEVTKSGNATLLTTENVVLADATSAAFTLTLPTAVGNADLIYWIKKIDASLSNIVTVDPNGSETIDGILSATLANRGEVMMIQSDGANWRVLGRRSYDVNGYRTKGSTLNQWYSSPNNGTALTTGALTASRLYAIPFVVSKVTTIDQMAISVTTAATGAARVGIYNDNGNNYPGTLVVEPTTTTQLNTGSIAVVTTAGNLPVTLDPGLYWLAIVSNAAATIRSFAVASLNPVLGYASTLPTNAQFGWYVSYTYAALPATFTGSGTALTAIPIPAVFVRTSS